MNNFSKKLTLSALSLCLFTIASGTPTNIAGAQAVLQGTQNNLQQQTGQAQQSVNTQNQVDTVQNTNQSSLLDQKTDVNLGVVSSPNQSAPVATIPPNNNLTAEISHDKKSSKKSLFVIAGSLFIAAGGLIALRNTKKRPSAQPEIARSEVQPEPLRAPKKHKKGTRKQRRKTSQH